MGRQAAVEQAKKLASAEAIMEHMSTAAVPVGPAGSSGADDKGGGRQQ